MMISALQPIQARTSQAKKVSNTVIRFGSDQFQTTVKPGTGIIACLGPSSIKPDVLEKMILAGTQMFRIDFGKGTHEQHAQTVAMVRSVIAKLKAEDRLPHPVRMMADLQGPRIAIGEVPGGSKTVRKGELFKLSPEATTEHADVIPTTYPDLIGSLKPGNRLIVQDGQVILKVTQAATESPDGYATVEVLKAGKLTSNAMVNAPDAALKTPALMDKDKADLDFALAQGFEVITLSYPGSADDVQETRQRIQTSGSQATLWAKIERPQTIEPKTLAAITEAADGVMVARGDLGTEMGVSHLPALQERIINEAKHQGKEVIVANKLLGSMVDSDQPSRSDAFDVWGAAKSGANWVMLTAETMTGQYPVEAVQTAQEIIQEFNNQQPPQAAKPTGLAERLKQLAHQWIDKIFVQGLNWLNQQWKAFQAKLVKSSAPQK